MKSRTAVDSFDRICGKDGSSSCRSSSQVTSCGRSLSITSLRDMINLKILIFLLLLTKTRGELTEPFTFRKKYLLTLSSKVYHDLHSYLNSSSSGQETTAAPPETTVPSANVTSAAPNTGAAAGTSAAPSAPTDAPQTPAAPTEPPAPAPATTGAPATDAPKTDAPPVETSAAPPPATEAPATETPAPATTTGAAATPTTAAPATEAPAPATTTGAAAPPVTEVAVVTTPAVEQVTKADTGDCGIPTSEMEMKSLEVVYPNLQTWNASLTRKLLRIQNDMKVGPDDDTATIALKMRFKSQLNALKSTMATAGNGPSQMDVAYTMAKMESVINNIGRNLYGISWMTKGCGAGFVLTSDCGFYRDATQVVK